MAAPTANDKCDHAGCECTVSGGSAVKRGDKTYCSEGCANGEGCDHPTCNCKTK